MAKWTEEQYREYKKSMKNGWAPPEAGTVPELPGTLDIDDRYTGDIGPESNLSGKIVKYCREHGYPCQCFRQSRKAAGFLVPGLPD